MSIVLFFVVTQLISLRNYILGSSYFIYGKQKKFKKIIYIYIIFFLQGEGVQNTLMLICSHH